MAQPGCWGDETFSWVTCCFVTFRLKKCRVIGKVPQWQDCFGQVVTEFGQVLAHSQEAMHCSFVSWNWHFSDGGYFGRIGLRPFMYKLVPMKVTDGILTEGFSQKAIDRVQHTSPRAAPSFGRGRFQHPILCRHTYTQISSAMLITPRRPSKNSCCRRWHFSGPEAIPNGMRL